MSNRSQRIKEQLGMSHGTAANRLRKNLMFKFAQELGYDKCFVCEERIDSADDLSIEHKQPWEGREDGIEKFWDLDNIAFSHINCNVPHVYRGGKHNRKVGPDGTAWCSVHRAFISIDRFWKNKSRWNGLFATCIDCYEQNHR